MATTPAAPSLWKSIVPSHGYLTGVVSTMGDHSDDLFPSSIIVPGDRVVCQKFPEAPFSMVRITGARPMPTAGHAKVYLEEEYSHHSVTHVGIVGGRVNG